MSPTRAILIVANAANLRRSLALMLRGEGYHETAVGSAEEACHCLQTGWYNLALLDLDMADIRGFDYLATLRPLNLQMRVLYLMADIDRKSIDEGWRRGVGDYLLKPVEPTLFLKCVHVMLKSL